MSKDKVYWTTKNGSQIDIDEMTIEHLRNVLKMIVKQQQSVEKRKTQYLSPDHEDLHSDWGCRD